jgi:foldase protein PrsA
MGKDTNEKKIICAVNGYSITLDDVEQTYQVFLDQVYKDDPEIVLTNEEKLNLLTDSLYTLIDERLIYIDAQKNNIEVSEQELLLEEDEFRKQFGQDLPLEVILGDRDISLEEFREKLKMELTISKMLRLIIPQEHIDDTQLLNYYNEHKDELVEQPSFKVNFVRLTRENYIKNQKKIEDNLSSKKLFSEIIQSLKSDAVESFTSDKFYYLREFLELEQEKIKNMKIGEIGFLNTEDYFSLFQLIDIKDNSRSFEQVKEELKETLEEALNLEIYNNYVETLFNEARIEFNEKNCKLLFH